MEAAAYSPELLIEAVKQYPYLYNKLHPSFKDRNKKDAAWTEIGNMLGISRTFAEKKCKNLKDIFKRKQQEVRDKQRRGAGVVDVPTIKWPHFEAMLELTEVASEPVVVLCSMEDTRSRQQSCGCHQVQEMACAWSMSTDASKMTYFLYSHAGQSASHEAVAQACTEHLAQLREHKTTNKRDDIAYFALRTDARLRALPIHVAQDLMHLMESMIYQAEVENRNTSN
nr:uncharacterized protein LOC126516609 [Dermacentor andersoni]